MQDSHYDEVKQNGINVFTDDCQNNSEKNVDPCINYKRKKDLKVIPYGTIKEESKDFKSSSTIDKLISVNQIDTKDKGFQEKINECILKKECKIKTDNLSQKEYRRNFKSNQLEKLVYQNSNKTDNISSISIINALKYSDSNSKLSMKSLNFKNENLSEKRNNIMSNKKTEFIYEFDLNKKTTNTEDIQLNANEDSDKYKEMSYYKRLNEEIYEYKMSNIRKQLKKSDNKSFYKKIYFTDKLEARLKELFGQNNDKTKITFNTMNNLIVENSNKEKLKNMNHDEKMEIFKILMGNNTDNIKHLYNYLTTNKKVLGKNFE